MIKIHLSTQGVEHGISTVGGMLGGAIGNGMEAGVDGFETYQDIHNHNYTGAIVSGADDSAEAKIKAMELAGITVAPTPASMGKTLAKILKK